MQTVAKVKSIHISPKKMRLVATLIRGLNIDAALTQLTFTNKISSLPLKKLLLSAVSNAEENHQLDRDNLYIKEIKVDADVTMHRWTPRAQGRATPIRKRTSQIMVVLDERVATKEVKKAKSDITSDLVTVSDLDELKALEKTDVKEEKLETVDKTKPKPQSGKASKAFVNKVFNRKSG